MKRAVAHRFHCYEESASLSSRGYSWQSIKVTTVYFECGHTRLYRGSNDGPKKNGFCKACEAGKKPVPLPDPLPQTKRQNVKDPIARALLPGNEERDLSGSG